MNIKIKILLTVVLTFLIVLNVAAQTLIYPDITRNYINKIIFTDDATGYFINDAGEIYKTANGGKTWQRKIYLPGCPLGDIKFVSRNKGFSLSMKGLLPGTGSLLSTSDAGETWQTKNIEFYDGIKFLPVNEPTLLKSTKQGEIKLLDNFYGSWKTTFSMKRFKFIIADIFNKVMDNKDDGTPYGSIKSFKKFPDSMIYAFGTSDKALSLGIITDTVNFVLKSSDNGASWDTLWSGFDFPAGKIIFLDKSHWWLLGQNEIYKTNNAGSDWQKILFDKNYNYTYTDIYIPDTSTIYVLQSQGEYIFYSSDSGVEWKSIKTNLPAGQADKIIFLNSSKGFAYGNDIFVTSDGGNNWQYVSKSIRDDIISIDFVNKRKGWAIGNNGLYYTTNGGSEWSKKAFPIEKFQKYSGRSSLNMIDSLYGWVNNDSRVFNTTDGGESWNEVKFDSTFAFGKIKFFNRSLGIIYNVQFYSSPTWRQNFILATTDGGESWNKYPDSASNDYNFNNITFSESSKLWGVNAEGLWMSTNMGKDWKLKYPDLSYSQKAITFLDPLNGFAALSSDEMVRTRDGGDTWELYYANNSLLPFDLKVIGPNNVPGGTALITLCPGYGGTINKFDFGTDIPYFKNTVSYAYTSGIIYGISAVVENNRPNVWIAGDGFTILYREYEEIISDVRGEPNSELPEEFLLEQNYPNPFNPVTKIRYEISKSGLVTLKIFDILGKDVKTLVNGYRSAGRYNADFNASNLAGGVYFYQLRCGKFISTKKMMLLK